MNLIQKKFSLKSKMTLVLLAGEIVFLGGIYFISSVVLLKNYSNIEENKVKENLERIQNNFDNIFSQLETNLNDWAGWDDTYKFVEDRNQAYIKSNLGTSSIANLKINSMVFINTEGKIVFDKMIDYSAIEELPIDSMEVYIKNHKEVMVHGENDGVKGLIFLPESPFLLVSAPILNSNREGPYHGTLIFAKKLDDQTLKSLEKITNLTISIFPYNLSSLPKDVELARSNLKKQRFFVNPLSKEKIAGYVLLKDIGDRPTAILKIEDNRDIYTQGLNTLYTYLISVVVLAILFWILMVLFFNKTIIGRFFKLVKEMEIIIKNEDITKRLTEGSTDEIGALTKEINNMLSKIANLNEKEKDANVKMKVAEDELKEHLVELGKINKLMVGRELKMIELKKEIEELKNKLENK